MSLLLLLLILETPFEIFCQPHNNFRSKLQDKPVSNCPVILQE